MKKIILFFGIIIILLFGVFLFQNQHHIDEFEYRTSKYHTFGKILVMVDGEKTDINGVLIEISDDSGQIIENTIINNNKFHIKKGVYGINEYKLVLPLKIGNVVVEIEHFNTNWWHMNDMIINVNASTNPSNTAYIFGSINTRVKDGLLNFNFETPIKDISYNDNILKSRTQSP